MSAGPRPLNAQRSPWERDQEHDLVFAGIHTASWERQVHDGTLAAFVAREPQGWHLSISHRSNKKGRPGRYPTWDEIANARYELLPAEITVALLLPPVGEYVAVHPTTFHLHQTHDM